MSKPKGQKLAEEQRKKRIEDFKTEYIALTQKYGVDFEPFLDANQSAIRANIRLVEVKKEEVKVAPLSPTEGKAKK